MSGIITITSDWHNNDYYTGAVKAGILGRINNVNFVDVSHNIDSFNHIQAAFILKSVYKNFPDGTIHLLAVNSELGENEHFVVAKYENQYFIANDNGCLGLIFNDKPDLVIKINTGTYFDGSTFPEKSVFADLACYILKKGEIEEVGEQVPDVVRKPELLPQIDNNEINAKIIYIDSYKNAITNITRSIFEENIGDKKFEISLENSFTKVNQLSHSYKDVDTGSILCLFNSLGLLEIAVRQGKATQLFNLTTRSQVRIKF